MFHCLRDVDNEKVRSREIAPLFYEPVITYAGDVMISRCIKLLFVFLAVAVSLAANAETRKYHPGHYVSMYKADGATQMIAAIKPGVVGMLRIYSWRELDTSKYVNGVLVSSYDFSKIQADMNLLAGQGMRLIVRVGDKTFDKNYPTPLYLQGAAYTRPNQSGGYTAVRWHPFVIARYNALLAAMGKQFDVQPNFEGVGIPETALGFDSATLNANGYTPELYRDALINVLKGAAQSFPNSQVFWYMNFLVRKQPYIADIATAVAPYGVTMGGPDVLPESLALVQRTYPFYTQFQGKMKLFASMQNHSYRELHSDSTYPTKYWTMNEMFLYARDKLHANYVFWNKASKARPSDSNDWNDAIPVIGANPVFNSN